MKTFKSAVLAVVSLLRPASAPAAVTPRACRSAILLTCLGFLSVERNGALLCCVPGAPVVHLPL
ncbi:hypothetical protein SAMN05216178_3368 [Pseudomonas saponiphila]|uniref:Uncharacterized protein n=1 Tax=Pseudomonas saponiphila TaxID=556534 RepID=A0A1H4PL03_9PSED|nr:hypothetical protein [Pseudomonas saponiphila]SEC08065.1 hypothetical protein SAMN05216178_3368 [Pseudomonas saponiphila]